jgi:hypothetical protein
MRKTNLITSLKAWRISLYLRMLNAHKVPHYRGSLSKHLWGTYLQLRQWECGDAVCYAGMIHSIYGTRLFKHPVVSYANRAMVQRLVGSDAERLAYIFSVAERPRAFLDACRTGVVEDTARNEAIPVTRGDLQNLMAIECANLIDQRSETSFVEVLIQQKILDPELVKKIKSSSRVL